MNKVEFLKRLIKVAQQLAPNRVPNGDAEMLQLWAAVIPFERYPKPVWEAAVISWHKSQGEFLEASSLPRHAERVARVWDSDREKRVILDDHRQARLSARIARGELPEGTTPVRRPDEQPDGKTGGREAFAQLRKELRRRNALRKNEELANRRAEDAIQALNDLAEKYTKKEGQ